MRLTTACGPAILAAAGFALSVHASCAHAQGLFGSRGSAGQNQPSATSPAGSLFSRNIGFPSSANTNQVPGSGRSFVGRSNQRFVGGGALSQSTSSGSDSANTNRRAAPRRVAAGEGTSTPVSREGAAVSNGVRRKPIIPRHRIAFEFPAKAATAISGQLNSQLQKLAATKPEFAGIKVQVEPLGRVKLTGQVPSDDIRKLAAIMVRLEPGVRKVQNELAVAANRD